MKTTLVFLVLLGCALAEDKPAAKYPHPFAQTDISLNGGSEHPVSFNFSGGVTLEEKHVLADAYAFYNTVRKDAPGISPNSKGRKRGFNGDVFYRQGHWHYGVGAEFNQFSITEYTKQSGYFFAGAGRDATWYARLRIMYLHAFNERTRYPNGTGCACTNNVQGIRMSAWLPNPRDAHHWFFVIELTPVWFHDTKLFAGQKLSEGVDSGLKFGVMYRF